MRYEDKLAEMGIAETRIPGLVTAITNLNTELTKLDLSGLRAYSQEFGIIGHLDLYARCTGNRNMAQELFTMAIAKAVRNINTDDDIDFAAFSNQLHYSAEQAAQLEIPGAKMLCRSLKTIRRKYEGKIGLSFSGLAERIKHVFPAHDEQQEQLMLRLTHKYNGQCRDMDDWSDAGNVSVLHRTTKNESMDGTNGLMFFRVWSFFDDKKIKQAIQDTYSWHGCSCTHDCCGCVSQSIHHMKRISSDIWVAAYSTSVNI